MISFIKNAIHSFLLIFFRGLKNKASILMYHSVGYNNAFFTVTPEMFRSQIEYILSQGYTIKKLSYLIDCLKTGKDISRIVCITVDDGYEDNYTSMFPLLKLYNIPATIFIATGFVGKKMKNSEGLELPMMTEKYMQEMQDSGLVEFMPHTRNHSILSKVSFDEAILDIENSKKDIQSIFNNQISILAYPKGKYTNDIVSYLKKEGWGGAVTVKEGLVEKGMDEFVLPRNAVDSKTSFVQFKSKVQSSINVFVFIKRLLVIGRA